MVFLFIQAVLRFLNEMNIIVLMVIFSADGKCEEDDNINYLGNDIENKIITGGINPGKCAKWCWDTPGCLFWTFNKLRKICYLKTSKSGKTKAGKHLKYGNRYCGRG